MAAEAASEFADAAPSVGHLHCHSCYSFTLCSRDGDACDFTSCTCGAVFHQCKADEHLTLCPRVVVACINEEYGCPAQLARSQLGPHLKNCPASVVMCMAEWNRWPVYTLDRQKSVPFRQRNPYGAEGQLDYDLALRDERMVNNLGKIPRKTRLVLRNNLTRRHPAVPLPRNASVDEDATKNHNGAMDEVALPNDVLDLGDYLEFSGIRRDKTLSRQMKQWQDDLEERLKGKERPPKYWEFPEMEKGNIHKHCAHCVLVECDDGCDVVNCRWKCGSRYHACKLFEHQMICPLYEEADEFAWMYRGVQGESRAKEKTKSAAKPATVLRAEELYSGPGEPAERKVKRVRNVVVPVPPPMFPSIQRGCRLDVRLETVTRLQTKPKSMYTFVCAQEFRRDEFAWHSKNVHSDIHGGLNNWMEHRCPMFSYGCGFSARRMFPHDNKHTLKYSRDVESFGVVSTSVSVLPPAKGKKKAGISSRGLMDLPSELLVMVAVNLDSFSLCNLALTCSFLRDICCSLLDTRGCVALQWERVKGPGGHRWQVAYKRWFFSTALDPIRKWSFSSVEAVSDHLKACPYNVKRRPVKKVERSKQWDSVLESYKGNAKLRRLLANYF